MQKIVDLSDLLTDDKLVRFRKGGKTYKLPGDIPAEMFLRIQQEAERMQQRQAAGENPTDSEQVLTLCEQLLELFRIADPGIDRLPPEASVPQLFQMIARVYGEEQPQEPDGPRPSKAGTRSTNSSGRKKSRS